jgi:hypothetical protein
MAATGQENRRMISVYCARSRSSTACRNSRHFIRLIDLLPSEGSQAWRALAA